MGLSPGSHPGNQLPIYPFLAFPPALNPPSTSHMAAFWHCFLITPYPESLSLALRGSPKPTNVSWQKVNFFLIHTI